MLTDDYFLIAANSMSEKFNIMYCCFEVVCDNCTFSIQTLITMMYTIGYSLTYLYVTIFFIKNYNNCLYMILIEIP